MKKYSLMVIGAMALMISLPALAQESVVIEEVIIKINDDIITLSEFNKEFDKRFILIEEQFKSRFEGEELEKEITLFKKQLFNALINSRLLHQKAERLGIRMPEAYYNDMVNNLKQRSNSTTEEEFRRALQDNGMTLEDVREMARNNFVQMRLFQYEVYRDQFNSESKFQEYYEEHTERYSTPAVIRLAQILFPYRQDNMEKVRLEAEDALNRIKGGEDFGLVYRELTPQSAPDADGDIGEVNIETLRTEMKEAVSGLEVGGVSDVVVLPTAFLVIKVTDKQPQKLIPLEEIKDRVRADMEQELVSKGLSELILKYKSQSFIDVRSDRFSALYEPTSTALMR